MESSNPKETRYKKEKRRSRIRSLRSTLFGLLFFWMLISVIMIGFLTYKVFSLEKEVKNLKGTNKNVSTYEVEKVDNESENTADISDTKKVYLTFDDGPSEKTDEILDILDDYGVKATFFVQGKTDEASKERLKRIVKEGHSIGMHTYSHSYSKIYASLDSFSDDVNSIHDLIYDTTGVEPFLYRFPGGSSNGVVGDFIGECIHFLNEKGYIYYDWNVASMDAQNPPLSKEAIVENVMGDVVKYKTSIVLLHDSDDKDTTVEALPVLIENLRDSGAIILPITEDTTRIQQVTLTN